MNIMKKLLIIFLTSSLFFTIILTNNVRAEEYDCSDPYYNDARIETCDEDCNTRCSSSTTYNACISWCEGNKKCMGCNTTSIQDMVNPDSDFADLVITIESLEGDVEIQRDGTDIYIAAKVGDKLYPGDIISTGFESEAFIRFKDIAVMTVKEMTSFSINQFIIEGNIAKTSVNLRLGSLRTDVKVERRMRASFQIVTPTSTVGVRGTEFEVIYYDNEKYTAVYVYEGKVEIGDENNQNTVGIYESQEAIIYEDGIPIVQGLPDLYQKDYTIHYILMCSGVCIMLLALVTSGILLVKKKILLGLFLGIIGILMGCILTVSPFLYFG